MMDACGTRDGPCGGGPVIAAGPKPSIRAAEGLADAGSTATELRFPGASVTGLCPCTMSVTALSGRCRARLSGAAGPFLSPVTDVA